MTTMRIVEGNPAHMEPAVRLLKKYGSPGSQAKILRGPQRASW